MKHKNVKKNEAKLISCLYDQATGEFLGLRIQLVYIVLGGDDMECFFSYGYIEKKSKGLYTAAEGQDSKHHHVNLFQKTLS